MAGIRGKNTKPEILLRRALHARGFRFRVHVRTMPGSPDMVFPKWRAVVLVHGCFWHRHEGCRFATTPKTRASFWEEKFRGNVARDERTMEALAAAGWRAGVVWECSLRNGKVDEVANRVASWLRTSSASVMEA